MYKKSHSPPASEVAFDIIIHIYLVQNTSCGHKTGNINYKYVFLLLKYKYWHPNGFDISTEYMQKLMRLNRVMVI